MYVQWWLGVCFNNFVELKIRDVYFVDCVNVLVL